MKQSCPFTPILIRFLYKCFIDIEVTNWLHIYIYISNIKQIFISESQTKDSVQMELRQGLLLQ